MTPSDSFGAGIFDDEIEEVPRETPRHEEEQAPSSSETVAQDDHDFEEDGPAEVEEDDCLQPDGEPKAPPRRRERSRGRGRDRDRDQGPEPSTEREAIPERGRDRDRTPDVSTERDAGRGRGSGERRERDRPRAPRGRREGEEERAASAFSDQPLTGAMPAVAYGVATGAGDAPAGTLVNQRVALLVDADALDSEANERHGAKVSYRRVFSLALRGRIAVRALAYMSEESEGTRIPFQDHLGSSGFETIRRVGPGKGAWNVRLALDALALASKVDTMVIASSSAELLPLLETLQKQGVRVEVTSFAPLDANPLSAHAMTFTPLGRSALYVL